MEKGLGGDSPRLPVDGPLAWSSGDCAAHYPGSSRLTNQVGVWAGLSWGSGGPGPVTWSPDLCGQNKQGSSVKSRGVLCSLPWKPHRVWGVGVVRGSLHRSKAPTASGRGAGCGWPGGPGGKWRVAGQGSFPSGVSRCWTRGKILAQDSGRALWVLLHGRAEEPCQSGHAKNTRQR